MHLALAVAHRREQMLQSGIAGQGRREFARRVRHGVDELRRPEPPRRHDARTECHAAVGERRAVFDHRDTPARDLAALESERRAGQDDSGPRVHGRHVGSDLGDLLGRCGVDLVDDHHIGHADVDLARVEVHLVAGAERVGYGDEQVGLVEREVVVAAVPQDNVGLRLGLAQDGLVVDAGVEDAAGVEVRLVFLSFLDRGLVAIEIGVGGVALDPLRHEVAVGHRMAHDHDLETLLLEQLRQVARGLALARAGARGARGHDWLGARQHRPRRPEQLEVGPAGECPAGGVHDVLVGHVAVGEDHEVDLLVGEQVLQLGLGHDLNAVRIERPGQLHGIAAPGDARNLSGRGKRHDLDARVVAVDDVEVMEVAPSGPHDHHTSAIHGVPALPQSRRRVDPGSEPWADEPVPLLVQRSSSTGSVA